MTRAGSLAHCVSSNPIFQVPNDLIPKKIICRSGVESLLEKGFQPTRTVVLAYGFDEEVSGHRVCIDLLVPY